MDSKVYSYQPNVTKYCDGRVCQACLTEQQRKQNPVIKNESEYLQKIYESSLKSEK